ncbi:MAG TPA: hypothetical protein VFY49_15690 [Myxococcota bacterium]|nr:hypothetical protein [Myxococcota bacterium]
MTREENAWKAAVLAAIGTMLLIGVGVAVANIALDADEAKEEAHRQASSAAAARASAPQHVASVRAPAAVVEDCNQYAAQTQRNTGRIVRDGVVGGAVGAGVGAAGGAIADGGEGAGKGAGIGAIVGAAAGTLFGLSEENRKSDQATAAYQQCMARRGY